MMVSQGDIYWVTPTEENGIASSNRHPYVIIETTISAGAMAVIVCALTTNTRKRTIAGNVLLAVGEANLPKASIVEVSKQFTLQTSDLSNYIGTLSPLRVKQIHVGIRFVERAYFNK